MSDLPVSDLNDDVRLIRRSLSKGFLLPEQLEEKLKALPDVADRGEWIETRIERAQPAAADEAATDA